jgi:peptidoglycan/LPS O-acetylase OafA/YrhL
MSDTTYLKGLNGIRFLLAMLVMLGHIRSGLVAWGIDDYKNQAILYKGSLSVEYFFILSGFLLTYLAITEIEKTGKIHIKHFFVRRILRILPLYYLVVFINYFIFAVVIPLISGKYHLLYSVGEGLFYHTLLLPNFITAKYPGSFGALYALWSIGVEEQFYLFFPFLMPFLLRQKHAFWALAILTIAYFCGYWWFENAVFSAKYTTFQLFIHTLKFHLMFLGATTAVSLMRYKAQIQQLMRNEVVQAIIWAAFLYILFVLPENFGPHISHSLVFCALLLSISAHQSRFFRLEWQPLTYLGSLAYGIYVFHSIISFFLDFLFKKQPFLVEYVKAQPLIYYCTEIFVTIWVAHLSYRYFEVYFLGLKKKFSVG